MANWTIRRNHATEDAVAPGVSPHGRDETVEIGKESRQEAASRSIREDSLTAEDKEGLHSFPALPLKGSGDLMDVLHSTTWAERLRGLLESKPEYFQSLLKLLNKETENIDRNHIKRLRKWGYLDRELRPLPGIPEVLSASLRTVGDGLCIVDPIDAKSPDDLAAIEQLDQQFRRQEGRGLKILARRLLDEKGDNKGRG